MRNPKRTCSYKVLEKPLFHKLKEKVRTTLFFESKKLTEFLGFSVRIASESLQHTGSFKFRAALNVVINSKSKNFIAISSGNFGQALAYACSIEDRDCTILMPNTSAKVKIDAVKKLGATVKLVDVKEKSRTDWLNHFVNDSNQQVEVVSPYDDLRVIEGNSSLADDLADYKDSFDTVIVPIGGGGLASGLVSGFERNSIKCSLIGAEPEIANDASRSFKEGRLVGFDSEPMTIADGARTLRLGEKNWAILKSGLDGVIEVTESQIEEAVKLYFDYANLKVEPTGAVSLAAVVNNKDLFQSKKPLCIVSGGNVDPELYAKLICKSGS